MYHEAEPGCWVSGYKCTWMRTARQWFRRRSDRLMKKHTVLVIAHRLSTVMNADRIVYVPAPHSAAPAILAPCCLFIRRRDCMATHIRIGCWGRVIADGAVQAVGTHEALLEAGGLYSSLVRKQLAGSLLAHRRRCGKWPHYNRSSQF